MSLSNKRPLLITILLLLAPCAFAVPKSSVLPEEVTDHGSSIVDFSPYEPIDIISFNQVPKRIRLKVAAHLIHRVGRKLERRLPFQDGQIINRRRLFHENPDAKDYEWTIPTYILNFMYKDPAKGLASYHAQIWLSSSGEVVQEINLPRMKKYSSPYSLVALADAKQVAIKAGLDASKVQFDITYAENLCDLVWRFSEVISDDGNVIKTRSVDVDAFSGKFVQTFYSSLTR